MIPRINPSSQCLLETKEVKVNALLPVGTEAISLHRVIELKDYSNLSRLLWLQPVF